MISINVMVGVIIYDVDIINMKFYLLKILYPHEYRKIIHRV